MDNEINFTSVQKIGTRYLVDARVVVNGVRVSSVVIDGLTQAQAAEMSKRMMGGKIWFEKPA